MGKPKRCSLSRKGGAPCWRIELVATASDEKRVYVLPFSLGTGSHGDRFSLRLPAETLDS